MPHLIDHTGKARPLRPAYAGPTYRWNFNPGSVEQKIGFGSVEPQRLDMTRRDFLMSSHLTQPVIPWWMGGYRIELNNKPLNDPDFWDRVMSIR